MSLPPGTWVLGITPEGIPLRSRCKGHIFEVGQATWQEWGEHRHEVQTAVCLVCADVLPPLEAEFFYRQATPQDVMTCATAVMQETTRLTEVHAVLLATLAGVAPALKNYDPL